MRYQIADRFHKSKYILLLLMIVSVWACEKPVVRPLNINEIRPKIAGTKEIEFPIKRSDYKEALGDQGSLQKLRLVPILNRAGQGSPAPEYRMFGISVGSAAYALGLRESDILVAANEFILYSPEKFKTYLLLLANEKNATIEIRRASEQVIYKYSFID